MLNFVSEFFLFLFFRKGFHIRLQKTIIKHNLMKNVKRNYIDFSSKQFCLSNSRELDVMLSELFSFDRRFLCTTHQI